MLWDLHGLTLLADWNNSVIGERWAKSFASRPRPTRPANTAGPDLTFQLDLETQAPSPPSGPAQFRQGDLLEYRIQGSAVSAYFPRYGLIELDLAHGRTHGRVTEAALNAYGVFEDLVAIGLSPHLRRRGMFLVHAFAAARPVQPARAALIVGSIGSGKTTTGLALLDAGWKLLSNDSPVVAADGRILAYPGLLAAYPDSLKRFASTRRMVPPETENNRKVVIAAEAVWPTVWAESALPGVIVFPVIERRGDHLFEALPPSEAFRLAMSHAVEQWDREMIPRHMAVLKLLVQTAPAYRLRLSADTAALPQAFSDLFQSRA